MLDVQVAEPSCQIQEAAASGSALQNLTQSLYQRQEKVTLFSSHSPLGNCCCLSLQLWSDCTSMQQMYETWQSKFGQGVHTACVLCSSCRLLKGNIFISITAVTCSFSGWCPDKYPIEKFCTEYEWAGSLHLQLLSPIKQKKVRWKLLYFRPLNRGKTPYAAELIQFYYARPEQRQV